MRALFIHQNFPGQYKHLATNLALKPGYDVAAIGDHGNLKERGSIPGVKRLGYKTSRGVGKGVHAYLRNVEASVLRGQAVARACTQLKRDGFTPDIICAHPGWGESLYLRDVFPDTPILNFFEFYYRSHGTDLNFDPEFPSDLDDHLRVRTWNMVQQSSFFAGDWGISPMRWQASVYPEEFRKRLSVVHDGIDTQALRPNAEARFFFKDGRSLTRKDELVTFVNRGLEPYRGFHVFMRALPELMQRRPKAHVVIVGGDEPSYGRRPKDAINWRIKLLGEVGEQLDQSRLHFVGKLPYASYVSLLQISSAHVYMTFPFVLSWSLLEAMALGAPIVASRTQPVNEVVRHEHNGLLFPFHDTAALNEAVCRLLDDQALAHELTTRARERVVQHYDLRSVCLPALLRVIDELPRLRRTT